MKNINVEDLSFAYEGDENLVLEDVNMEVEEGEFVCLLGQSGCGKSTFLRLLAGLETPTAGEIRIGDEKIIGTDLERSVVFQDYGLFPWMSTGDNIILALQQKFPGKTKTEYKDMAREALGSVHLAEDVFNKYPKELSGGMQQRCAIARSFALNPSILLMDEPFGALDAVTRAKLQDMVLKLWQGQEPKKTVFFVTHDVEEALLLATRIFVFGQKPSHIIFDKRVEHTDKPNRQELYDNPDIKELRTILVDKINQDVFTKLDD